MPYHVRFTESPPGAIVTFHGEVTRQDIIDSVAERFGNAERAATFRYTLGDYSAVTSANVRSSEVAALGEIGKELLRQYPSLVAIVVAPKEVLFGLARMWGTYSDSDDGRAVLLRTRSEADLWIAENIPPS